MDTYSVPRKRCSVCNRNLPETSEYFYKQKHGKNGLRAACINCIMTSTSAYHRRRPEIHRRAVNKWQDNNREKVREQSKQWRKAHPDYAAAHREQNPNIYRKAAKKWRERNPDKVAAYNRRRRARECRAVGAHTASDIARLYERQKGLCAYCDCSLNNRFHVDHIHPLSLGGSDDVRNLALACQSCNLKKGDKVLSEWLRLSHFERPIFNDNGARGIR